MNTMTNTIRTGRTALAAITTALVLSACGTEPEEIDEALLADMALLAADATIEDVFGIEGADRVGN